MNDLEVTVSVLGSNSGRFRQLSEHERAPVAGSEIASSFVRLDKLRLAAAVLAAAVLSLLAVAGHVSAQDVQDEYNVVPEADPESTYDSDSAAVRRTVDPESSRELERITLALVAIAVLMTVLLVMFLWHTSPQRRLRVARRRSKAQFEIASIEAPDTERHEAPRLD